MRRVLQGLFVLLIVLAAAGVGLFGTASGQDWLLPRVIDAAMRQAPVTAYDGLRVFMCGTASPLPSPDRAQACVAVLAGEDLYLVDAGAGSNNSFALAGESAANLRAILLTHFHSDHISGIADFNLNSWVSGRPEPLVLVGPAGIERIAEGFNEAFALDRGYRVAHHGEALLPPALGELGAREIAPGETWTRGELTVTAFVIDHSPVSPALGYRFDYKGRSVVVSGDGNVVDGLVNAARGADLLLQDVLSLPIVQAMEAGARRAGRDRAATILEDIQDYHAGADTLQAVAGGTGPRMLAAYHLVPPPRNMLMERIFLRDLPDGTVLTRDGMVFELPAGGDAILVSEP